MSGTENKSGDSHWWEVYFVRYFVGTVVGGAIILYLNASETSSLYNLIIPGVTDVSKFDNQLLLLLATMGLAYCYISSAPILVFHATRGVFLALDTKVYQWSFWGSLAFVGVMEAGFYFFHTDTGMKTMSPFVLFSLVMLPQIVLLCLSFPNKGERVHSYYRALTKARSRDLEEASQYMESYKHLREHGNAFFILLFELMFGTILALVPTPTMAFNALLAWIMPAALVWLIGTVLEYRFATQSQP